MRAQLAQHQQQMQAAANNMYMNNSAVGGNVPGNVPGSVPGSVPGTVPGTVPGAVSGPSMCAIGGMHQMHQRLGGYLS